MKTSFGFSVLLAVLLALGYGAIAQEKQMMKIEGENLLLFQEIMLILSESDGKVVVQMDPPEQALKGKNADIDIKAGDEILMMNGKRVQGTAVIREMYDQLEMGDEIKLGVKRGEEMFIVRFDKADQPDTGGQVIIRPAVPGDENQSGKEEKEL